MKVAKNKHRLQALIHKMFAKVNWDAIVREHYKQHPPRPE